MRLVVGILSAVVLSAPLAMAFGQKVTFTNVSGRLQVTQDIPCGAVVNITTSVADGRLEITPSPQDRDGRVVGFDLTRLDLFVTPFSVNHECLGQRATAEFREIGVRLANPVSFTGAATGRPEDGVYRFSIPKDQVLIFESVVDNQPVPQPQTAYQRPSEDVTGEIDLVRGTTRMHVVLSSKLRFRAGCVGKRCAIDEELKGTQTMDLSASIDTPRKR
jgi:hypothetical protein